jgi:hypothetical protein
MFTDTMGRRERERKRWNENNVAFTNKTGMVQTIAAQKSRRNHNSGRNELTKHIHNIKLICYGLICVNMTRNDGKASAISTSINVRTKHCCSMPN